MTITHSDKSVEVTDKDLMFLVKLNQLTDAELSHHFPKLDQLTRDQKIKCIVFNLNCNPETKMKKEMNIYYEFIGYVGSVFTNVNGENIKYETIKNNFFNLNGRKGKLIYQGYTSVYEHGFSGGYENYGFVFQDDLSSVSLHKHSGKILLEAVY